MSRIVVLNTHGTPEGGNWRRPTVCVSAIETRGRTVVNRSGSSDAILEVYTYYYIYILAEPRLRRAVIEKKGLQTDKYIVPL